MRIMFFFFQAEDGIRDGTVTGVQTCALPISVDRVAHVNHAADAIDRERGDRFAEAVVGGLELNLLRRKMRLCALQSAENRSEERRVGKECRCRWWQYY